MIKIFILFTFLNFLPICISQENSEIDSLLKIIHNSKNDSLIMDTYNKLRRATSFLNNENSLKFTKKFLEYAKKNKYSLETAMAQYYMGNAHVAQSEYPKALQYYLKSAAYFEKVQDSVRLSSVINGIGAAYEKNGNDSLSLKYFYKAFHLSKTMGDKRRSALALNNLANIYKRRGDAKKALFFQNKAVAYLNPNDIPYYALAQVNLANILMDNNQSKKAQNIFEIILNTTDLSQDAYTFINAKKGLGFIAFEEQNYAKASIMMEEAYNVATQNEFFELRYEIMGELINAYSQTGQDKKGLEMSIEYLKIRDSIFSNERDKNLSNAIQKYEVAKKDKEIVEQKLQLEEQTKVRNWLILGSIFIVFFALLIYFFLIKRITYQKLIRHQSKALQKQKIAEIEQHTKVISLNSMIEGQEAERSRIAKDLHDGLGGLLSTVKAYFTSFPVDLTNTKDSKIYHKMNAMIDEACGEVRRISHNMMPHSLSLLGLEETIIGLGESLRQNNIQTKIEVGSIPFELEDTKKIMIYRLIQELVSNIRKHANAENVLIQLLVHNDIMNITIEDDGYGFDQKNLPKKDGLGVNSVISRVNYLNGKIEYDCQINKGCSVNIQIPMP